MIRINRAVKLTISDAGTGEVLETKTVDVDDYCLVMTGMRFLKSYQVWGSTHTLHVGLAKPGDENA